MEKSGALNISHKIVRDYIKYNISFEDRDLIDALGHGSLENFLRQCPYLSVEHDMLIYRPADLKSYLAG